MKEEIKQVKEEIKENKEVKENKEENINKKRKIDTLTNNYIEQLIETKKRSKPWSNGMSKYTSITLVNDRWRWQSNVFSDTHINFKEKEEAESHYEKVIAKYNIDPFYITREGYLK